MLTPLFEINQDDEFIILIIQAPYAKVAETEFHIQDDTVCFFSKPYYLRLHLPGKVVDDDDRNEATYNVDKGSFNAKIAKETKGEFFDGLDMLTKLLTPPDTDASTFSPYLVEEISDVEQELKVKDESLALGAQSSVDNTIEDFADYEDEEDFDWYIEQDLQDTQVVIGSVKYGFAQTKSGMSEKLLAEFNEVLDNKDPDNMSSKDKREQRLAHEKQQFCEEHYLADLYDNDEILEILKFEPWWLTYGPDSKMNDEEKDKLLKLPKKSHIVDKDALQSVYLGLVDIVFAYVYNHRVLYGESNVESGWTIAKLSATLSWFDSFSSIQDVVLSSFRRALAYPLHRNWQLCVKALEDVQQIFSGGKKPILKCLLEIHSSMIISDPHYIFNDLYITDYSIWIQTANSEKINSLAEALKTTIVKKGDIGFELEELEVAAALAVQEQEQGVGEIISKMGDLDVENGSLDSDDDSDSESDTDSDEETDDSSDEEESTDDSDQENGIVETDSCTNSENKKKNLDKVA